MYFIFVLAYLTTASEANWTSVWMSFFMAAILLMTVITLASVNHIHKHSMAIRRIGIRTDARLMQGYVVCWLGLIIFSLAVYALSFCLEPVDKHGFRSVSAA